jgi:hypothetical protein
MNVGLGGLVAAGTSTASDLERLQPGGHDPARRGFTMQNLELSLDGMVDPYFRAQANLLFTGGGGHGGGVEVEEAWLETLALPGNLQLRAGQLMTEFGRHNPTHPHTWAFADQPLVMGRMFGADGLRNPGARLSWLVPTPFYSELCLTLQNSQGDTAFSFRNDHEGARLFGRPTHEGRVRTFSDLLFTPRYAMSFDLTENQTLLLGVSAAFGPNGSGPKAASQVYGVDWFWKWKSSHHHGGFPFVAWQSEVLWRRYRAGAFAEDVNSNGFLDPSELDLNGNGLADLALPRELLTDYGFYSQISWGFTKGWVAALRGDYVAGNRGQYENSLGLDPDRARRWRLSPNLTWYPSEFSKIRLQYNYDDRRGLGGDHSLWLQLEFLLGAHGAHKF